MRITVKGRNIEITDAIRSYAEEKIGKVMNHYDQIQSIDVVLNVIKNPSVSQSHTAEVICKFVSGSVQAEESAESMYASIDLVADKISRQVKKFKEKQISSSKNDILDFDLETGHIKNITTGKEYSCAAFPKEIQELVNAGGLINYTKAKLAKNK